MFRGMVGFFRRLFREFNRGIVQFTRWVGYLFLRGFLGLWGWARTRNWSYLVQALPAAMAAIVVIVLVGLKSALPAQQIETHYREEAKDAAAEKKWTRVVVCQDRLVQMGDGDPKALYAYGIALENLGQPARAMQVMKQIAPEQQHGLSEAHLWIANKYRMSNAPNHRSIVEKQCQLALERVGELKERGNEARWVLGELYFLKGAEKEAKEPEEARTYYEKSAEQFKIIVETWEHMHLRYAQVLKALKRKSASDEEVKSAIKFNEERVRADARNAFARLGLADAYAFRGDFAKAIQILQEAPAHTIEEIYKHAIAQTYFDWQLSLAKNAPDEIGKQVDLIDKGLRYEPLNPFLLHRLLEYLSKEGTESELAAKAIARFDAENGGTATSKFLVGMAALRKGKNAQAEKLFDLAYKLHPDFPVLCNNFAWMLAEKKDATDADLKKALDLVNIAINRNSVEPSFHDTRGTVYMRQKRWEDAAVELESVLHNSPGFRGEKNIHARLSAIYHEMGLPEQAAAHGELALK